MSMLDVENLSVTFNSDDGPVTAVKDLSFSLNEGQRLAIVGESGSGKSQTVFAMLGLLAQNGQASGSVRYEGEEILNVSEDALNKVRARKIGMIFQDPMTSLNPYMRISDQMAEVLIHHEGMSKRDAIKRSVDMLDAVRIPEAKERIRLYPHEFSGGMRQRVMIAMSLLCRPKLLIADEPTTALDVTIQAQIMNLFKELQKEFSMGVILITHDLGVVAGFCDNIIVLYGGSIMERGPVDAIFENPAHPYTCGLLNAIPRLDSTDEKLTTIAGMPPNMLHMPRGCPFSPRCQYAEARCSQEVPQLETFAEMRQRACFHDLEKVA